MDEGEKGQGPLSCTQHYQALSQTQAGKSVVRGTGQDEARGVCLTNQPVLVD